jgi:hypothetical protein
VPNAYGSYFLTEVVVSSTGFPKGAFCEALVSIDREANLIQDIDNRLRGFRWTYYIIPEDADLIKVRYIGLAGAKPSFEVGTAPIGCSYC